MIEEADPHTSVTFVHLACSGGRIHKALLGPYPGIVAEPDDQPLAPQIERVAEIAGGHEIDALFLSIGGNDINFSKVLEACILGEVCHLGDPVIAARYVRLRGRGALAYDLRTALSAPSNQGSSMTTFIV